MAARSVSGNHRPNQASGASHASKSQSIPMSRITSNRPPSSDSPRPSSVGSTQSNHSSSNLSTKGGHSGRHEICVGEELKIAVDVAFERFRLSEEQKELEFPSCLTATERAYIHQLCKPLGFKSKSKGKSANRYLTITKKDGSHSVQAAAVFSLVRNSRHQIHSLIQRFPITNKERQDLQPRTERGQYTMYKELNKTTTGRLNNGVPQVPPPRGQSDLNSFRQTLPVFGLGEEIMKAVLENKVILVSGETGSGKTTQVPQMILDEAQSQNKPCRIFCTQPRRLSALSVAERVAAERGEKIGQAVGYQIRLESRVSPKTLLTFCTSGVLLRTLMGGDGALATVTHIIVDEIHERDRFTDFLLITLRDLLPKYRNLKLVLMSAALNIQLFSNYFSGCPIVHVPGRLFEVQAFYLEDVLKLTGYSTKEMHKYKQDLSKVPGQQKELDAWCSKMQSSQKPSRDNAEEEITESVHSLDTKTVELGQEKEELQAWLIKDMDGLLTEAWLTGNGDIFTQIFHLILSENVSVDYQHSETSATPLMIAAGRGFVTVVEQLLNLGANVHIHASNDWTALDWARKFDRTDIMELLEAHMSVLSQAAGQDEARMVRHAKGLTEEDKQLLASYHHSFDDEKVNINLIATLIYKIHSSPQEGAILIFLPGYDEIVSLRDKIHDDKLFADGNKYILYVLHSAMQSSDQRRVFKTPPPGVRKIILSTNLAETSVTIDDVVFVIDSGKVKEKSFDAITAVSMLKVQWVSRASAVQRRGRAGRCRPGVAYHLFSGARFENMQEYQDPEILRHPLQEICLHTKLLAPVNCPIADFIAKAPEAPSFLITRNAVHILKQMDALDAFEDLTELGHHLADLPVEPRYAKMVLYSVVLKCIDPVLTTACCLAYRNPFILPAQPYQKRQAAMAKRKFSSGAHSDHMALLRAFQSWQRAKTEGWERSFCEKNFLSASTMEMIFGMRTQLLGQLRASGFVRARGGGDIRDLNTNSENWAVVKAALCAGMYPNIIRVDRSKLRLITLKENKVRFHNSSVLSAAPNQLGSDTYASAVSKLPTDWLVYEEMTRAHIMAHVRCSTAVSPITVAIFAGAAKLPHDVIREAESGVHVGQGDGFHDNSTDSEGEEKEEGKMSRFRVDDWIQYKVDPEAASLAMQLRQKWHSLFIRRMRAPSKPWSQVDENVIRTVISVLTNEEQALGLQQPAGIGQRPRPMSTDGMTAGSGGSRRGSYDTEQSDDSSTNSSGGGQSTPKGRSMKVSATPPKRKDLAKLTKWGSEEKSETSSVRSSSSAAGSANNSGTSSLRGSAASSPCQSPQPGSPTKWTPVTAGTTAAAAAMDVTALSAAHPHQCRYLVAKCNTIKQLDTSQTKGIWATSVVNEKKISKMFKDGKTVYLIFSVQGSGHFQGYSRVTSMVPVERVREFSAPGLAPPFQVEWVKRGNLPFPHAHNLQNPWNENKRVQIARDGQEIEPSVGESLLKLWERIPAYVMKNSPQGNKLANKNFTQGHNTTGQGQGAEAKSGSQSDAGRHSSGKGFGGQHWGSGSSQGQDGKGQGQWGSSHAGYGSANTTHTQTTPTSSSVSVPGQMPPPHVNSPFNPLYMPANMSQGQMFSQQMSPGQNMSPVMILQRGQGHNQRVNQGGQGHSQASGFSGQAGNFYPHGKIQKQ